MSVIQIRTVFLGKHFNFFVLFFLILEERLACGVINARLSVQLPPKIMVVFAVSSTLLDPIPIWSHTHTHAFTPFFHFLCVVTTGDCVTLSKMLVFYSEELLSPHPTPKPVYLGITAYKMECRMLGRDTKWTGDSGPL